ncbi:MAG: hypothetical protein WBB25_18160 [Sulfitobacter sp.]
MKIASTQPSLVGQIQFFDNYIPVLHDGDSTITVTQEFTGDGSADEGYSVNQTFVETQKFTVTGPRFALDPADVHREFPPPGHQGRFESVLPHITLTKRALPWERKVFANANVPWLALLVFAEGEILDPVIGTAVDNPDQPNPTRASTILLEELTDPPAEPKVVYPDVAFDPYEEASKTLCAVIDVAPATFSAVVPSQSDLIYLTHGRKVNIENKSASVTVGAAGARTEEGTQWFSVIVAGRFPEAPNSGQTPAGTGKNIAHLVSLEGLTDYIAETQGGTAKAFPAGTERVRMVSLASWTFSNLPVGSQSFADLMNGLVPDNDTKRDQLFLRLPQPQLPENPTATETYAFNALSAGYTARTYATRQGEDTFAWYRGPFVQSLPERFKTDRRPFSVSGQAVIYDQEKGLFDMSYASAFEIGRLAAVHSGVHVASLRSWRTKGQHLLDKLQHRLGSSTIASLFDTQDGVLAAEQALQHSLLSDSFIEYLTSTFIEQIMPSVQDPNPNQPSGLGAPRRLNELAGNDAQQLIKALEDPDIATFLRSVDYAELAPILTFLANLYLLHGVPFNYLVPDNRMLPDESVRFFYVDRNWLDALVDGAMSVGLHTGIEVGFQAAMNTVVSDGLLTMMHSVRDNLLGVETPSPNDAGDLPLGGMLIRSAVVSGWPGLEVHAEDADGNEISLLRMDHVGPQVLLCLFAGVPAWVAVNEPQEGLHFGLESDDKIYLRNLSGDKVGYLKEPEQTITASVNADRMLDVAKAVTDLTAALKPTDPFGAADFAVELVDVPERFVYAMPQAEDTQ